MQQKWAEARQKYLSKDVYNIFVATYLTKINEKKISEFV